MLSTIWGYLRILLFGVIIFSVVRSCFSGDDSGDTTSTEEIPTQGLITTVAEVQKDNFKIESEIPVDQVEDSRIIGKYLDGSVDTMTLQEAKLHQTSSDTTRRARTVRTGGLGLWFFMMSGRMGGGHTPRSSAYVNNQAYQNTQNNAGSRLRSTATRTTRTKSGYGSGKSGRSFGG
ncbi:hypothetical protein CEQ90_18990 [Lewinellaceae bacterium SD302]|nr:hypothetical protein CEQ90_18990 [Lewinellaceae bacterium SD302]